MADPGAGEALVSLRDAAARLGLSPEALRQRIEKGRLPATRETDGRRRYLIAESDLQRLVGAEVRPLAEVVSLRVVGEGEVPVEALDALLALLRDQFGALQAERDRLLGDLGRLQGELDAAEARHAALEGELVRLQAKLAAAPAFFLARLASVEQDWTDMP